MILYRIKLALLKNRQINYAWRYWSAWRGKSVGNYSDLLDFVRKYAKDKSFVDVGCMWGVNGRYSFLAEDAGATEIKAVDVFGPTPEFEAVHKKRLSAVEFLLGDITDPALLRRIGEIEVVFCAGVLYHHPSPFQLIAALRQICKEILILRTFSIPEMPALPQGAVFIPYLEAAGRKIWNLQNLGIDCQQGITGPFDPKEGYGNFFWGMTPSCLRSLLTLAGFTIEKQTEEPFAQTFVCQPTRPSFDHQQEDPATARLIGQKVSSSGTARPA
jgi:hypothetical protein